MRMTPPSYVRAAVIVYLFVYILMLLGTALLLKEIPIILAGVALMKNIICSALSFFYRSFASFSGSYMLFRTPETSYDSSYLMRFSDENNSYYLQKASPDITFYVESDNKDYTSLFTMTDYEGTEISCP